MHSICDLMRYQPNIFIRSFQRRVMMKSVKYLAVLTVSLLILSSCNIIEERSLLNRGHYLLVSVNGQNVEASEPYANGLFRGVITLQGSRDFDRRVFYKFQDGSTIEEHHSGTYRKKGVELDVQIRNKTSRDAYTWSPRVTLEGDTLTFYNPCVFCRGTFIEVYVRS